MTRRVMAEAIGTALLLFVVVGSGLAVEHRGGDPSAAVFTQAVAAGAALVALIAMLQGVSGAHLNPAVTIGFWRTGGITGGEALRYGGAQVVGAIGGVVAANLSFGLDAVGVSPTARDGLGLAGAETVSTFVLVLVVLGLVRSGRAAAVPGAVGAWVAAVVIATASGGFANPAVTLARQLAAGATGIAPWSVPAFLAAQLAGGLAAAGSAAALYPTAPHGAPAAVTTVPAVTGSPDAARERTMTTPILTTDQK